MARRSVDSQAALTLEAALGPLDVQGVRVAKVWGSKRPATLKVADLLFVRPQGLEPRTR
jgi:hypothetical protein